MSCTAKLLAVFICYTYPMSLVISSTVKRFPPHPYAEIANAILGKRYELSLVFVGTQRATTLNKTYRQKTYSPNVLSFPLDESHGEIFICPQVAAREAAECSLSPAGYVAFLFIHGCLHLKGHAHGDTMDTLELKFVRKFNIS